MTLADSRSIAPTANWPALLAGIEALGPAAIAYSGGVDSALLLKAAHDVLGADVFAVTAVSPSLAPAELAEARSVARLIGARHVEVATNELDDARYVANAPDRCHACKTHLFDAIDVVLASAAACEVADAPAYAVAYGATLDDLGDFRPGMAAARERGVAAPLLDAGLGKAEVREASRRLGLPTWDKPALACLASRIPHGTPVTADRLAQVDAAESAVRSLGFRQVRVRHFGEAARVEVDPAEIPRAMQLEGEIAEGVRAAGFARVHVDREGYRSGRLNAEPKKVAP